MSLPRSRPFTLLILLGAGWIGLRAGVLDLSPPEPARAAPPVALRAGRPVMALGSDAAPAALQAQAASLAVRLPMVTRRSRVAAANSAPGAVSMLVLPASAMAASDLSPAPLPGVTAPPVAVPPLRAAPVASRPDRFTLSAWLLARNGNGAPALSGQAALGGSQLGARGALRLDRRGQLELFARATSAGRLGDGAEGALGVALRPHPRLPVQLVAERREAIAGEGGRSAFAAYAVGGVDSLRAGPALVDAYGAAGMVGARSRDWFAEGSAVARLPVARLGPADLSAGGGVWAAAQPGASRVDVGPRVQLRWREGPVRPVVSLDWRQRVAGDARPSSGPALTLGADF
jgi:hypothetical protein